MEHAYKVHTPKNRPDRVILSNFGETLTEQEHKDDCDINVILDRMLTKNVPPKTAGVGSYGDFSTLTDFHEAQELILKAKTQFNELPAKVRDRFGNDPGSFLDFIQDRENIEQAHDLGLLSEEGMARVVKARQEREAANEKMAVDKYLKTQAQAGAPSKGGVEK